MHFEVCVKHAQCGVDLEKSLKYRRHIAGKKLDLRSWQLIVLHFLNETCKNLRTLGLMENPC